MNVHLKICISVLALCFFTAGAMAQENPDLDGDGVANSIDICPYIYGPASNKGCPDSSIKDPAKVWTDTELIDTARAVFLHKRKSAYSSMQRQNALDDFADEVGRIARENNSLYAYALTPLLKNLGADWTDEIYAELIALTFNRRTRFTFDNVMTLMPAVTRAGVERLQAGDEQAKTDAGKAKVQKEAKEQATANTPEAIAKRKKEEACAAMIAQYNYQPGAMFTLPYKAGWEQQKLIITGPFDCAQNSFPGMRHYWVSTVKKKGYFVAVETRIKPADLKYAQKAGENYSVCFACAGTGILEINSLTKVQIINGYEMDHGKVVVASSDPHWVNYGRAICNRCSGGGLIVGK